MRARRLPIAAWCATAAVALACGSSAPSGAISPGSRTQLTGSLTVFAAASLTAAFDSGDAQLESRNPGLSVTCSFAGSQQLVQNILNGAPADVVATADAQTMQRLVNAHLVSAPLVFAHNVLEIAVAPGNPRRIRTLADLAAPGVTLVLADPSVPAGKYAAQALQLAGVRVTPASLELSVTSALEKVESGDADAAIVYATDVTAAAGRVDGVPIPAGQNVLATYVIATVDDSTNAMSATAFVRQVVSGVVRSQLTRDGFLPP